jgi:hypothetical protein
MFVRSEDLPTDHAQIESDTEALFEDLGLSIDAVIILGQLDPTQVGAKLDGTDVVKYPMWSEEQQKLILKARDLLEEWQS